MFGSLLVLVSLEIHDHYRFTATYANPLHIRYPLEILLLAGAFIAVFGIGGMFVAIMWHGKH